MVEAIWSISRVIMVLGDRLRKSLEKHQYNPGYHVKC